MTLLASAHLLAPKYKLRKVIMSSMLNFAMATINYYAFLGYYNHIVSYCEKILKLNKDPVIILWQSFGHVLQGNLSEAIRGFNSIKQKKEVELAALVGLLYAYNQIASAGKCIK